MGSNGAMLAIYESSTIWGLSFLWASPVGAAFIYLLREIW